MNGDVKSYNLNRPMTWEEFRSMPQDLQIMYIKKLRNEFGVPDIVLSKAMGICKSSFSRAMSGLNLSLGKSSGATGRQWLGSEKSLKFFEYWNKFSKKDESIKEENIEDAAEVESTKEASISKEFAQIGTHITDGFTKAVNEHDDLSTNTTNDPVTIPKPSQSYYLANDLDKYAVSSTNEPEHITVPTGGRLSFDCKFDDAVKVLESILSGTNVRLNVDWIVVKGD